ncbi:hypothetical protein [Litoreibacter ponti]|uniref:hypothetical protein n=1 Tax=Litoreibacter ponti TaxID=1510457 RepID=UPI0011B295D0|nr:hypothetical protein [Litoreibacter ponti]
MSETDAVVALDIAETLATEFTDCEIEPVSDFNGLKVPNTRPARVTIAIVSAEIVNQELCDRFLAAEAGVVVLGDSAVSGRSVVTLPKPFTEEMLVGAIEDSLSLT